VIGPLALPPASTATAAGALLLGFLFGLKHATEADHLAAVGAIVSERRGWRQAASAGALWGAGHTLSIVAAGVGVLLLRVTIPESAARWLELAVALMIIVLGGAALARALRSRPDVHVHAHTHDGTTHAHLHFHGAADAHLQPAGDASAPFHGAGRHEVGPRSALRGGLKPFLVGIVHGLAGSAALTLLVLSQIASLGMGLLYLLVFGAGSIGGMVIMSLALSVPFAATLARPVLHRSVRVTAGLLAFLFGLFYALTRITAIAAS
jgi:ABC-type nickel/cobalt efflux system permease component RcnA